MMLLRPWDTRWGHLLGTPGRCDMNRPWLYGGDFVTRTLA